jgi:hypothetical protein
MLRLVAFLRGAISLLASRPPVALVQRAAEGGDAAVAARRSQLRASARVVASADCNAFSRAAMIARHAACASAGSRRS